MMRDLTQREIRFCDEYLICFNATDAAIKAGYSKKTARSIGSKNLTKPDVQRYLETRSKKIIDKLEITQERTMLEIGRIAFADPRKLFDAEGRLIPIPNLDDNQSAIIASFEQEELFEGKGKHAYHAGDTKKIKMWNKTAALDMLAKHFKIYEPAPAAVQVNVDGLSKADMKTILALKKKIQK